MASTDTNARREVQVFNGDESEFRPPARHRDRKSDVNRDFSIHDPEGGITYHARYTEISGHDEYVNPRHRHDIHQLRFYIRSSGMKYDKTSAGDGWLVYLPEGVYYGPMSFEKERHDPRGYASIGIQMVGPTGGPFMSRNEYQEGIDMVIQAGGEFKKGICHWPDGRKQDAQEAVRDAQYPKLFGKEYTYPDPVFTDPVWFNTNNIAWKPSDIPGVSVKRVACFQDEGPAVSLIKLEPGASAPAGKTGSIVIRHIYEGEAEYAGQRLPAVSNLYYPPDTSYEALTSKTGATVYQVELQATLPGSESPLPYRI